MTVIVWLLLAIFVVFDFTYLLYFLQDDAKGARKLFRKMNEADGRRVADYMLNDSVNL